jgi:hypothetical protein
MARKRKRDFVADVQEWSEQSGYTRSWSPSPAAGGHPLRLRGAARSLPRLALYVLLAGVVLTAVVAIFNALTS